MYQYNELWQRFDTYFETIVWTIEDKLIRWLRVFLPKNNESEEQFEAYQQLMQNFQRDEKWVKWQLIGKSPKNRGPEKCAIGFSHG